MRRTPKVTADHLTPRRRRWWWVLIPLVPILIVGGLLTLICLDHDPLHVATSPNEATAARVYEARHVIADYYATHGNLPADLRAFLHAHYHELDTDSVNRPFQIRVREDGVTVEIGTLGDDRRPGGTGMNRDITGVFRVDIPAGEKIEQVGPWLKDPLDDVKPWKL